MTFRKTIAWIFWPLTMWYGIGVAVRNFLFAVGIKKQHSPHVTTIGVGNLVTGGTGKTPHVEYLLRLLGDTYPTALLSRGYKRKTSGYVLADEKTGVRELGDEPAMMHRKFKNVAVAVCEQRWVGIQHLLAGKNPPQLIVMDDVYQHRNVKPTLNILLTEYNKPYYSDRILPYGDLREFRSARDRANIIIVTKSPQSLNSLEKHAMVNALGAKPYQKVFFSYIDYGTPINMHDGTKISLNDVEKAIVLTGIANPKPMQDYVASHCEIKSMEYADHYNFKKSDANKIKNVYQQLKSDKAIVITTEKDVMRLMKWNELLSDVPIYYLPIEIKIHQTEEHNFDKLVSSIVKENISFLDKLKQTPIGKSWK